LTGFKRQYCQTPAALLEEGDRSYLLNIDLFESAINKCLLAVHYIMLLLRWHQSIVFALHTLESRV